MTLSPNLPAAPEHYNRPGLLSLLYRADNHPTVLRRMLARLSSLPLAGLKTRDDDDPAIALLDAWAVVADIFTFYQERIANEGFLRSATERRSVLELARAIGYELRPGVAAGALLAFTVEEPETHKKNRVVTVPKGTKIQSIPRQGQMPQTFETSADFTARYDWNALRPRLTQPYAPSSAEPILYLSGINSNLKPGDLLLLIYSGKTAVPVRIQNIAINREYGHTRVKLVEFQKYPIPENVSPDDLRVIVLGTRLGLFGCNAPARKSLPDSLTLKNNLGHDPYPFDWDADGWSIWNDPNTNAEYVDADLYLERSLAGVVVQDWLVIESSTTGEMKVYQTAAVVEASRYGFGLNARVTGLKLTGKTNKSPQFKVRETVFYLQSESLQLAEMPLLEIAKDATSLTLDQKVDDLQPGQLLALSGERENAPGETVSELVTLKETLPAGNFTVLDFRSGLQHGYVRKTVTINANVARATHGETVHEALGSGDGSQANQRFSLRRLPLTHVSASAAGGAKSTLEVRVNNVLWEQVESLHELQPGQKGYQVRINDDGATQVMFGDGQSGARLPSGQENVAAAYRIGIGPGGEVDAHTLTLLQTRPQGIRSVTNPLPAADSAPPDDIEQARARAPMHVVAMDRLVCLKDYEHFASTFAGIGKTQAVILWAARARLTHLTVAGLDGEPIAGEGDLYRNLRQAIDALRDPLQPLRIDPHGPLSFRLSAKVLVAPGYQAALVFGAARQALSQEFSFDRRSFGQPVNSAEVITVIQGLPGVVAVDLDSLYFTDKKLNALLPAETAYWDAKNNKTRPAQLLTIDPTGIDLEEMQP